MSRADRSDPAVRVEQALTRSRRVRRFGGVASSVLLAWLVLVIPAAAYDSTQGDGAFVGVAILTVLLALGAYLSWPASPDAAELRHRELEAIWREIRADADTEVAWDRFGVWATADGEQVRLELIVRAGASFDPPSPYGRRVVGQYPADDAEGAATEMEVLREQAAAYEEAARRAYVDAQARERDRHYDSALDSVEREARDYARAAEERLSAEVERQERKEREAEAQALARALRRP